MRVLTFESSNIGSASFDEKTGVCVVTFKNGRDYAFANFTQQTIDEWGKAPSAGAWFHRNVRARPDRFPPTTVAAAALDASRDLKAVDVGLTTENSSAEAAPPPWQDDVQLSYKPEIAPRVAGSWRDVKPKMPRDKTMERLIYYDHDQHEWVDEQGNIWRPLRRLS